MSGPQPSSRDHPRSRGVYSAAVPIRSLTYGSSPLARGLRVALQLPLVLLGIIPARAGFTIHVFEELAESWDHPRSRGVYRTAKVKTPWSGGSSPLARGLRATPYESAYFTGIIPARAGFTTYIVGSDSDSGDHPRSRGVYVIAVIHITDVLRIIPARAGFTAIRRCYSPGYQDHPRSRGVYPSASRVRMRA